MHGFSRPAVLRELHLTLVAYVHISWVGCVQRHHQVIRDSVC